jgi:uncharacterized protein (DUF433 family)
VASGQDVERAKFAATRDTAASIAGLSRRQVDYWASTGLVRPAIEQRVTPRRTVRLYGYTDLMSLLVAATLRRAGISLQHIRVIVEYLRSRGYPEPLTQLSFAVVAGRVYFQHDDGTWEGDLRPDQVVIHEVLDLDTLRARIRDAEQRHRDTVGHVEKRRGVMGSKPVIAGTRIPVATVQRFLSSGRTVDDVLHAYPQLERADVDAVREATAS